jgi:hypothetical protein
MTLGNFAYNAWRHSLEDESMPKWEDIRPQEKSPGSMPLKQSANGSKRVRPTCFPSLLREASRG